MCECGFVVVVVFFSLSLSIYLKRRKRAAAFFFVLLSLSLRIVRPFGKRAFGRRRKYVCVVRISKAFLVLTRSGKVENFQLATKSKREKRVRY